MDEFKAHCQKLGITLPEEKDAYSIPEFCRRHGISESFFFAEMKEGRGPRTMKIGHRRLISKEAAAEWRRECETAPAQKTEAA
jgi:predicted DNA-binding transcriptional regulator AlpA